MQLLVQRLEQEGTVADHRNIDLDDLVDRCRIDVHVDLACLRTELVQLTGDAIVEPRADAHDEVGVMHREIRLDRSVHAEHAEEARIGSRKRAQSEQRQRAGCVHATHDRREELASFRPGIDQSAAAVEDRATCGTKQGRGFGDALGRKRKGLQARSELARFRERVGLATHLKVLGEIDQDRSGTALGCHGERLADDGGDLAHRADLRIPFRDRAGKAERVAFLKRIGANRGRGHLAADANDRDGVADRVEQSGDGIADARTGRHQHDAGPARAPRVALGRVHGGLLVAHEHMTNPGLGMKRIVDRKARAARVAEDRVHAMLHEGFEQAFGAARCSRRFDGGRDRPQQGLAHDEEHTSAGLECSFELSTISRPFGKSFFDKVIIENGNR